MAKDKKLKEIKKAYFIGIGGAGMSGIAKVMREMGLEVAGSDIKESSNTKNLEKIGVKLFIGHKKENLIDSDVVVSSTAIPKENKEVVEAKKRNLTIWHRAKALAYVAEKKKTIAVCGTHGKTTTTSMTSLVLEKIGANPTFLIGGELNDIGSNAKYGSGKWLVAEADESDGSLIHIKPQVLILNNVEADHLDYFKDYQEIEELFKRFVKQVPEDGCIIYNGDYANLKTITDVVSVKKITFGFNEGADYLIKPKDSYSFTLYKDGKKLDSIKLLVAGQHNILNATASIICTLELGYNFNDAKKQIEQFSGVHRRFEKIKSESGLNIIDDYAHHPTEIKATLSTARKVLDGRLICVYQPHRYSRTKLLKNLFKDAFDGVDELIITDVYSSGEYPIPGVTGKLIVDEVINENNTKIAYLPTLGDATEYIVKTINKGDNLITMGAGDVWQVARQVAERVVI